MSLTLKDFYYDLPKDRIAHQPVVPRDSSKLLVLNRHSGAITHSIFNQLSDFLRPGDMLVRNNTKVIPGRLFGKKETGGAVEVLLNKITRRTEHHEVWECLTRPGLKPGQVVVFSESLQATCLGFGSDQYTRQLEFTAAGSTLLAQLHKLGELPLPPYIQTKLSKSEVANHYQTTFAKHPGSAAAPTAGLHFTPELDKELTAQGVSILETTLHVGLGTFLPVKTNDLTHHSMHAEYFELGEATAKQLNVAKQAGNRIIAVGTTTVRTLESCVNKSGLLEPQVGETEIFMYPPFKYNFVDGIITNFHLPESTLLMLISAFVSKPNTNHDFSTFSQSVIGKAYESAIKNDYRFFSFGDAMLIL